MRSNYSFEHTAFDSCAQRRISRVWACVNPWDLASTVWRIGLWWSWGFRWLTWLIWCHSTGCRFPSAWVHNWIPRILGKGLNWTVVVTSALSHIAPRLLKRREGSAVFAIHRKIARDLICTKSGNCYEAHDFCPNPK